MDIANKIRCGRTALEWTRDDLSSRSGVSAAAINKIESRESQPSVRTLTAIEEALNICGVYFTSNGVELRKNSVVQLRGDDWYLRQLDDVERELENHENKELLILFNDDKKSPPAVVEKHKNLRAKGIKYRSLVEAGNEYLQGPLEEYRCVPKEHFKNWVTLIYGDKVSLSIDGEKGCTLICDSETAEAERLKFNLMWSLLPQPKKSTADVRF